MKPKEDMRSVLKISKIEIQVRLLLLGAGGKSEEAALFVSEFSSLHSGPESIEELLNRGPLFLPVRYSDGTIRVLNRDQILYVEEEMPESPADSGPLHIHFIDGTRIEARLYEVMPERYRRTLDFFNGKRTFLPMYRNGARICVNKKHVAWVREAEG